MAAALHRIILLFKYKYVIFKPQVRSAHNREVYFAAIAQAMNVCAKAQ